MPVFQGTIRDDSGLIKERSVAETAKISIDDTVLVRQCQQGDSAAIERLILKYQGRIYNTILKMCANADDAAELTQDTFVKIIESIDKFEGKSSFYTWAFRIAVNLTINYCKRSSKLQQRSLNAEQQSGYQQAKKQLSAILANENMPDPAAVASNNELCELIIQALTKLDDQQRAVVILRDIEGMDYAQIAEVLDTELGTVKSRLSRARTNLREIMEAILQ